MNPKQYFDFTAWRLGFALGSYWAYIPFEDGSRWMRIGLGIYWRVRAAGGQDE